MKSDVLALEICLENHKDELSRFSRFHVFYGVKLANDGFYDQAVNRRYIVSRERVMQNPTCV